MNLQEVISAVNSGIIAVADFNIDKGVVVKLDVYTDKYNIIYESNYNSLNEAQEEVAMLMIIDSDTLEKEYQDFGKNTAQTREIAQYIVEHSFISNLGEAIKLIREEQGLTQDELRAITKYKHIDEIENNSHISLSTLERFAPVFKLTEKDIANKARSL